MSHHYRWCTLIIFFNLTISVHFIISHSPCLGYSSRNLGAYRWTGLLWLLAIYRIIQECSHSLLLHQQWACSYSLLLLDMQACDHSLPLNLFLWDGKLHHKDPVKVLHCTLFAGVLPTVPSNTILLSWRKYSSCLKLSLFYTFVLQTAAKTSFLNILARICRFLCMRKSRDKKYMTCTSVVLL